MPSLGRAASGAIGGAKTGAAIGSFVPGIGTGIGAAIGGIAGGIKGLFGGGGGKTSATGPSSGYAFRESAMAPARAAYAGATRDVNRRVALQGGYSPGAGVLRARLAREGAGALSEAALQGQIAEANYDIQDRNAPSHYERRLRSIGGTMDIIGRGAGALSNLDKSGYDKIGGDLRQIGGAVRNIFT